MFVVPFEPCAKCYALAFKSKLFSQAIPLITITVVITNIKKKKMRLSHAKWKIAFTFS